VENFGGENFLREILKDSEEEKVLIFDASYPLSEEF
jgi:hypothetical protein